jgi:hypothetical protein
MRYAWLGQVLLCQSGHLITAFMARAYIPLYG